MYVDAGISGSIELGKRPEGAALLAAVRPGDIIVTAKLDRAFRSAVDALQTMKDFKSRRISFWPLDIGNDCTGNGISELMLTIMAAVATFERERIGERIREAKGNQKRAGKHLGGLRPFGFAIAPRKPDDKRAPVLVPIPAEQQAIGAIRKMREAGCTLRTITAAVREQGFKISHEGVRQVLLREATP
jgi:DNA invertase Pin-like site-specific DNA recombinase